MPDELIEARLIEGSVSLGVDVAPLGRPGRGSVDEDATPYADEWIDELRRESVVETDERDGQMVVRLRADIASPDPALALS